MFIEFFVILKIRILFEGLFEIEQLAIKFFIPISHGLYILIEICYFLCNDMFTYHDCSDYEVASLFDVYFRNIENQIYNFYNFFTFSSFFQGMRFPDDITDQFSRLM